MKNPFRKKNWIDMGPEEFDKNLRSMRPEHIDAKNEKILHATYYFIHGIIILSAMIAVFYPYCK